jgi:aminoglycoside phosphotransferase (APT) family kinase protein
VRELSPLAADTIEPLGAGTESAAFRVERDWVVRFPIAPRARASLATELALLPALAPRLPVAVPRPEHVAERDGRLVFTAYRALEGEPLSDAALAALPPPLRARALDELIALLDAIHGFPVETAQAAGVSFELLHGGFHPAQERLVRGLPERRAFDDAQPPASAPVLLHADIKPAHLLHDPASGALTGLLDWGDASLGHPEFDLAIISAFCGPATLRGLLDRMDPADAARAVARIPFLLALRRVQDAVYDVELRAP